MKRQIGFIGLGAMGSGMAANLLAKAWPLTVWAHRNQEAALKLVGAGARQAATPRALAEGCDIVLLCVTGSPQVEAVVKGPEGLAAAGKPLLIVDCSTSNPSSTIALAAELAAQGVTLIDAPLARTPKEAAEGKLDVMVGGAAEAVARARPVLEAFAARVVHTG
ncbi:MAG: NAD(P)-dependent oxidoreductase, partial [Mesorhizobium sp.]|uniref:NAD(P)-dependent oxidoreductase n=2 Tax=Mesorhizobium sp. TaxID=1871066 RepID=UPI000FEA8E8C